MVRRLVIAGCLTWLLVSMLAESHTRSRRYGQVGWASWYGPYHHGRQTASGKRFSMYALTAAHRSLPFGTTVRVTNLDTGQQVQVTINDRGPFVDRQRRIIDLSHAAAERIGLRRRGIGRVRLDVLEEPATNQTRPAPLVARATQARPPRPSRVESAASTSQTALAERRRAERLAADHAGESVARPRLPGHPGPAADFAELRRRICAYAGDYGRSFDDLSCALYYNININDDREVAIQESQRFLEEYYTPIKFPPDRVAGWVACGAPQQCLQQLQTFVEAGATDILLRFPSWDQKTQFKRCVEEVLPHFV
jgi:rare lipoprotein A